MPALPDAPQRQGWLQRLGAGLLLLFLPALASGQAASLPSGGFSRPELLLQNGHSAEVRTVAFSPQGNILASGSSDQTVKLWQTDTGTLLRTLRGHTGRIIAIAFSADGRVLATTAAASEAIGAANVLKVWEVSNGRLLRSLEQPPQGAETFTDVALSPDGQLVAAAGASAVTVWEVDSGRATHTFAEQGSSIAGLAFSPDGRWLASGGDAVRLWDVTAGRKVRTLTGAASCLAFGPGERLLGAGSGAVHIWDVTNGRLLSSVPANSATPCAFGAKAQTLAWVAEEKTIQLWDVPTHSPLRTFGKHGGRFGWIHGLSVHPDGSLVASAGEDHTVKLWRTDTGALALNLEAHADRIESLSFSPDQRTLAVGGLGLEGRIDLWDVPSGSLVRRLLKAPAPAEAPDPQEQKAAEMLEKSARLAEKAGFTITGVGTTWQGPKSQGEALSRIAAGYIGSLRPLAYSPDGRQLVTGTLFRFLEVWEPQSGKLARTVTANTGMVKALAFSPDGKRFASGGEDKSIKIWDASTYYVLHRLDDAHASSILALAFSPDGTTLASSATPGTFDNSFKLWDTERGVLLREIDAEASYALAFSPNGRWLAGGASNLRLWNAASGKPVRTLIANTADVASLAFSKDGKYLAVGHGSGPGSKTTATVWEVAGGKLMHTFSGHTGPVWAVAFSPDGKLLATGSDDATLKLWSLESGELLATAIGLNQGRDWLVTTPDGLFDGSLGGWQQVRWRFSEALFDTAPVELFFSEFYRPGLLAEILAGKNPRAPRDLAQLDRRQPVVKLGLGAGQVPSASLQSRTIKLKLEVAEALADPAHLAGSGVRDLRLFRNGSLVKLWRGDVPTGKDGKATLEATVPIVAGENRLTAYAFNRDNIKSADTELLVTGAESLRRKGTAYILAIGINEYANPGYNLKYAVADAQAFAEELRRQQAKLNVYGAVEIISLLDQDASKANLLAAFGRLAGDGGPLPRGAAPALAKLKAAEPEDAVFVYYAGHGTAAGPRFYLIPHDLGYAGSRTELDEAGLKTILEHSLSDRELEQAFEKIDAGRLLLVIDACNSGQALEAEEKRRGPMNSKGLAQLAYEKGMYVLTASQGYQAAQEAAQLGHGFLTYALVEEGLKTAAADNAPQDGQVVLREWLDYATLRVPQMQEKMMLDARTLGREVAVVDGEEKIRELARRSLQRPRVFYRREPEAQPLVVARPLQ